MNRKMSIMLGVIICLVLAASLFMAACGPAEPEPSPTPAPSPAPAPTPAPEEKPIELKYASTQPPGHAFSLGDLAWIDKIHEETNGRVHIEPYWAGALMSDADAYYELRKGVADIAYIGADYIKEGFDIEKATRILFYGSPSLEISHRVYDDLRSKFPEIDAEWSGVKIMAAHGITPYQLLTLKKPVRMAEDFRGLTIKASGDFVQLVGELGGEGVPVPMSETYVALQKGTIDGCFSPYECLLSFKFGEVVKYATNLNLVAAPTPHRAMNWDSWNKLPPDIQEIFENNRGFWEAKIEEAMLKADDAGIAFGKEQGVEFITLPPEELDKVYEALTAIVLTRFTNLDAKGLPGTDIAKEARRLIEEYSK